MTAQWHSAHVHYHTGDADTLILDAVRPLVEQLGCPAFFTRHWLRGPHVRLAVLVDEPTWSGQVRPLIDETIGGWLVEHPSTGAVDMDRELAAHRWLAELEEESGEITPWHPDNTIDYPPYDRRLHVLGSEAAADLLASFHADTTELAFAVLAGVRAGAPRLATPLDLMLATAELACPPITRGVLSYRSHVEGFLANCADPAGMRTRFDQRYEAVRDPLAERLGEVLATVAGTGRPLPYLAGWAELVRRYYARTEELVAAEQLRLPEFVVPLPAGARPRGYAKVSEFHAALGANEDALRELREGQWFAIYRVLLNYQYLLFSRLGLRPVDRFLLCYLAARTVEDTYGLPAPT
jgi:hypothetical protein